MYWVSLLENKQYRDLNPWLYGHEDCAPGQSFGYVVRDFWMIYYVDAGKGELFSDNTRYELHAGQLFFIRPGANTRIVADKQEPWFFHWIGFDGISAQRLLTLPLVMDFQTELFNTMDLVEEYIGNREEYLISQLFLLFCQLFPGRKESQRVRQIRQYISTHYREHNVIENMAQGFSIDRHYLGRVFRKETGESMQAYLCRVRFRQAQALLKQGYSCLWTAEQLGYSDLASFSRAYKQYFGYAPSTER